jgi:hypothetical protein
LNQTIASEELQTLGTVPHSGLAQSESDWKELVPTEPSVHREISHAIDHAPMVLVASCTASPTKGQHTKSP